MVSAAVLGKKVLGENGWVWESQNVGFYRLTPQILSAHRDFHSGSPFFCRSSLLRLCGPCSLLATDELTAGA